MIGGSSRAYGVARTLGVLVLGSLASAGAAGHDPRGRERPGVALPLRPGALSGAAARPAPPSGADSLFGLSGKLRVRLVDLSVSSSLSFLRALVGDSVRPQSATMYTAIAAGRPLSFITLTPFARKTGTTIGPYRVGRWPGERRRLRSTRYANPSGFVEVTPENQDTYVSEHFRLRDFLTHDQGAVWPKYVVLREALVDKLELIVDDLRSHGVQVHGIHVMSGFRTPQYNARGVGRGGRAELSRHMYGDAADIWIDTDGSGRMGDLNGDGRVDARDARVILDAAERVERAHPSLVGGGGLYRGTRGHGPFAHIDVRGSRARWGRA